MKRIIAVVLIVLSVLGTFCACSNNNNNDVPTKLDNITSGYTGDVKVGQDIKTQKLDIVLGKYIFTINNVRYRFKDFEKTPKRTTKLGDYKMDIYVKDSTLQKCILRKSNEYGRTVYSAVFMATSPAVCTMIRTVSSNPSLQLNMMKKLIIRLSDILMVATML